MCGLARTFFTHSVSPRTDTTYFTPPTSTGVIGIVCVNLLRRLITVMGSLLTAPVASAIRLKILAKNHDGLMSRVTIRKNPLLAATRPFQPGRRGHQPDRPSPSHRGSVR